MFVTTFLTHLKVHRNNIRQVFCFFIVSLVDHCISVYCCENLAKFSAAHVYDYSTFLC